MSIIIIFENVFTRRHIRVHQLLLLVYWPRVWEIVGSCPRGGGGGSWVRVPGGGGGKTNYFTIGICCFSAKHPALMNKSKDWQVTRPRETEKWRGGGDRWRRFAKLTSICEELLIIQIEEHSLMSHTED